MFLPLVAAIGFQASYRQQFPLPSLTVPSGLGVNIHFIRPNDDSIARIAAAGIKWVRMDLFQSEVQRPNGTYKFTDYDELLRQLQSHGLRAMFILDSGDSPIPRTPELRHRFIQFVHQAVQRYRHKGVLWEVWNEPNTHWGAEANSRQYIELARDVGEEIRRSAPDEYLVGPASAGMDWGLLEACVTSGLLEYWDAVTVHPYRETAPETASVDYQRLRSLIALHSPPRKHVPIYCGEWGYSDYQYGPEKQAQYAARMYLANIANGVPLTIWYDWWDDTDNSEGRERHFGLVRRNLAPKEAFGTLKDLHEELGGCTYKRGFSVQGIAVLVFAKDRAEKYVAYAGSGVRYLTTPPDGAASYRVRKLGQEPHVMSLGRPGTALRLDEYPTVFYRVITK